MFGNSGPIAHKGEHHNRDTPPAPETPKSAPETTPSPEPTSLPLESNQPTLNASNEPVSAVDRVSLAGEGIFLAIAIAPWLLMWLRRRIAAKN